MLAVHYPIRHHAGIAQPILIQCQILVVSLHFPICLSRCRPHWAPESDKMTMRCFLLNPRCAPHEGGQSVYHQLLIQLHYLHFGQSLFWCRSTHVPCVVLPKWASMQESVISLNLHSDTMSFPPMSFLSCPTVLKSRNPIVSLLEFFCRRMPPASPSSCSVPGCVELGHDACKTNQEWHHQRYQGQQQPQGQCSSLILSYPILCLIHIHGVQVSLSAAFLSFRWHEDDISNDCAVGRNVGDGISLCQYVLFPADYVCEYSDFIQCKSLIGAGWLVSRH